jgi:hypothetical protein
VRDSPLDPVQLAFMGREPDVGVVCGKGSVYWFKPDARDLDVTNWRRKRRRDRVWPRAAGELLA